MMHATATSLEQARQRRSPTSIPSPQPSAPTDVERPSAHRLFPEKRVQLRSQETLYREGCEAQGLFLVHSGLIKLVRDLANGKQRILRVHCSGEILGIERLLGGGFDHTAVAMGPVEVSRAPVSAFTRLRTDDPVAYAGLMAEWHRYTCRADTWITRFLCGAIKTRVARFILFLADLDPATRSYEVALPSGDDIGAALGVAPETVSRVVAELKRQDILELSRTRPRTVYRFDRGAIERDAEAQD